MSERFKEMVLKTIVPETVPWVRIPLSPPGREVSHFVALFFLSERMDSYQVRFAITRQTNGEIPYILLSLRQKEMSHLLPYFLFRISYFHVAQLFLAKNYSRYFFSACFTQCFSSSDQCRARREYIIN